MVETDRIDRVETGNGVMELSAEFTAVLSTEEPINIARELIGTYHRHLAGAQIAYLWRIGKWMKKGVIELGKATKLSGHNKLLAGYDLALIINKDRWPTLTEPQKRALVDHELSHVIRSENGGYAIRGHDVEDFISIVERHGFWSRGLDEMWRAREKYEQLPLPLDAGDTITAVSFGTPEDFKAGRQVTFTREEAAEIGAIPSSTAIMADYLNKKVAATRPVQERVGESPPSGFEPASQAEIRICFGSEPDELCAKGYTEDNGENIPPCPRLADCRAAWDAYEAEHSAEPEEAPAQPAELPTNDDTRITPAQAERMSEVMGLVEMYGAQQVEAALSRPPLAYREPDGAIITVRQGLGDDWGSFRQPLRRRRHRVTSPKLPMRQTREEAEVDLIAWAEGKGLERVDMETGEIMGGGGQSGIPVQPPADVTMDNWADYVAGRLPAISKPAARLSHSVEIDGEVVDYVEVFRARVAGKTIAILEATKRRATDDAIALEVVEDEGQFIGYAEAPKEMVDAAFLAYHEAFSAKTKTA